MTEIDVVKKNSRVWLWVLIAIAIVAGLMFLMRDRTTDTRTGQLIERGGQPATAATVLMPV